MEFFQEHIPEMKRYTNIPTEVKNYACGYAFGGEFEFVDNLRIAEKGNRKSERAYEKYKAQGCCGFIDYRPIPFLNDGKEYYFGFNYGH